MRDYLIAQNIVRKPSVAAPGGDPNRPPLWLEPRNGVPAPGESPNDVTVEIGPDSVLGAYLTGGIPARPFESSLRVDTVDVWFRTSGALRAFTLEKLVRAALVDKRNWTMGTQVIIDSEQWRALQRLESNDQGFIFIASYMFQQYVI